MFLIAKIVRGRRLLHELEQQEKDEAAAAIDAAHSLSQMSKRLTIRQRRSQPTIEDIPLDETPASTKVSRRKTMRQKTIVSGSVDSSLEGDVRAVRRTSSMPSLCDALTVETTTSGAKPYDYESKLNKMQRRALRFTWHRLQTRNGGKRVENVFEEVFERLVRQLPQIREMFTTRMFLCAMSRNETSSLRDHAKVTVKMIDLVIKNLDAEKGKRTDVGCNLDPRLIGRSHGPLRPYGFTGQYWEKLGETMVDVVLCQEAVRDLPGAGQAWVILTACLIDQLRAGFEENRNTQPVLPKRSQVLHHATRYLHSESLDEPSTSVDTRQLSQEADDQVAQLSQGVRRLPFTPKLTRHPSVQEEPQSTPSSSSPPVFTTCPFSSRGSMKDTRTSPETPVIAIN